MTVDFGNDGPGKQTGYKYDWDNIITTLKSRPGRWGIVSAEGASSRADAAMATALRLKRGMVTGTSKNEFDATVRKNVIYARYIGANGEYANDEDQ